MSARLSWWNRRAQRYPHHVTTPASVRPERVPAECGHHISVTLHDGVRTWGFETAQGLAKFNEWRSK